MPFDDSSRMTKAERSAANKAAHAAARAEAERIRVAGKLASGRGSRDVLAEWRAFYDYIDISSAEESWHQHNPIHP